MSQCLSPLNCKYRGDNNICSKPAQCDYQSVASITTDNTDNTDDNTKETN